MSKGQVAEHRRALPKQGRSRAAVDAICEAAAQVFEQHGEDGFNTNAVAERAGVSVGTLYRYFPDKEAVLVALAEREMLTVQQAMKAALCSPSALAPDRAAIRAFLHAFAGRTEARRAAVTALLARSRPADLQSAAGIDGMLTDRRGQPLPPLRAFVLTRALLGAMRAAVMEGADFLLAPDFEDELVRLARTYVG